ncbi:MAG: hypothetical protein EXS37_09735 [Opitutus sp.]|nr:hypothetical protein [Opitutus sp.]
MKVTNPQDEFGEGGGAGVQLDAEELVGIDGGGADCARALFGAATTTEAFVGVENFALEDFEMGEGDVEEITAAAGGIEDAEGTKVAVKFEDFRLSAVGAAGLGVGEGGGEDVGPRGAERLDDGGEDKPFDVGARGVVGAEFVAFGRIERTFEQGAEDGGFDFAPLEAGSGEQEAELGAVDRKRGRVGEEATVEVEKSDPEDRRERGATVEFAEELFERGGDAGGRGAVALERLKEPAECVVRNEADVFGEHAEKAASEKGGDKTRIIAILLKSPGEFRQVVGRFAGDSGGIFRRVERNGVEPEGAKTVADFLVSEIGEQNAVGAGVGEREEGFTFLGEVGEEFKGVADIDDDNEGRRRLGGGEIAGVAFGLSAGFEHGATVEIGAGRKGSADGREVESEFVFNRGRLAFGTQIDGGLLGFEDEAGAAVEVDLARCGATIGVMERDGAFEDIGVLRAVGAGGIRVREREEVAELSQKKVLVGALRALGVGPAGDKCGNRIGGHAEVRERSFRSRANARGLAKGKFRGATAPQLRGIVGRNISPAGRSLENQPTVSRRLPDLSGSSDDTEPGRGGECRDRRAVEIRFLRLGELSRHQNISALVWGCSVGNSLES